MDGKAEEKMKKLEDTIATILENKPEISISGSTVQQLSDATDTPRSTVSWHLNRMEAAGVLQATDVGRAKVYCLSSNMPKERKKEDRM